MCVFQAYLIDDTWGSGNLLHQVSTLSIKVFQQYGWRPQDTTSDMQVQFADLKVFWFTHLSMPKSDQGFLFPINTKDDCEMWDCNQLQNEIQSSNLLASEKIVILNNVKLTRNLLIGGYNQLRANFKKSSTVRETCSELQLLKPYWSWLYQVLRAKCLFKLFPVWGLTQGFPEPSQKCHRSDK